MSITIKHNVVHGPEEVRIPAHLSLGQFLYDRLKEYGDRASFISADTGECMTHKQILQKSINLAVALKEIGLKKDDIVLISSDTRFEYIITILAISFCGATSALLNTTYSQGEIKHLLNIIQPKYIFVAPVTAQTVYDCCEGITCVEKFILFGNSNSTVPGIMFNDLANTHIDEDGFTLIPVNGTEDTAVILCSSGTTGLPKGVMLSHLNILTVLSHFKFHFDISEKKKNYVISNALSLVPWFHTFGYCTTFALLSMGVDVIFLKRFQEEHFLKTVQDYKVNWIPMVPSLAVMLAKNPIASKYDLSSLHEAICGAAPISKETMETVMKRTGIGYIKTAYGLTESTLGICIHQMHEDKLGSCGCPSPGVKVKVVSTETGEKLGPRKVGEICMLSPLRMKGYLRNPEATEAMFDKEGYLRTGDVGYYDEHGYFYIVDRVKELIKYKGFQVAPAELEALLLQHSGVKDCGVVGKPDELAGELPVAFVVLQPGAKVTDEELVKYVAERVSPAKRIRGGVIFIDEIPKNASGKILRRSLAKMLEEKQTN